MKLMMKSQVNRVFNRRLTNIEVGFIFKYYHFLKLQLTSLKLVLNCIIDSDLMIFRVLKLYISLHFLHPFT